MNKSPDYSNSPWQDPAHLQEREKRHAWKKFTGKRRFSYSYTEHFAPMDPTVETQIIQSTSTHDKKSKPNALATTALVIGRVLALTGFMGVALESHANIFSGDLHPLFVGELLVGGALEIGQMIGRIGIRRKS